MQKKTKKLFKKKSKPFKKKSKSFKKKSKQFKKQNKKRRTLKKKIGGYFFKKNNPLVFDMPWKYPLTTWFAIANKGSETRRLDEDKSFFPGKIKDKKINKIKCECKDAEKSSTDTDDKMELFDKTKLYDLSNFKFLKHPINSWFIVSKDGAKKRQLNMDTDTNEECNC